MRKGFTIIELLIVISVIGVLAGVMVSVIDARVQQDRAGDSVRRANLEQLVDGLETYFAVEGDYPTASDDPTIVGYIQEWPDGEPEGAIYSYWVNTSNYRTIGIVVIMSSGTDAYKYRTEWGEIRQCTNLDPSSNICTT